MLKRVFLRLFIWLEGIKNRVIKIICDKSASAKLPEHVFDELARCLVPDILAFYKSPEGYEEYENRKLSQTQQMPQSTPQNP